MSAKDRKAHLITRVGVQNWKNFSTVETTLQQRTFIVGPNACGKSNFLDVFRFLRDLTAVGGGLQKAVLSRGGVKALRCLAARRRSHIAVSASMGTAASPERWRYDLAFKDDRNAGPVVVFERVLDDGEEVLSRPDSEDEQDPVRLRQTHLEQLNVNRKFRPVAEFFASIRYLHLVPQLVREPERVRRKDDDPFGSDFLDRIATTPTRSREARLARIVKVLQVAVPQLNRLELDRDKHGLPHLRGRYEHWRFRGAWQNEAQFSDGTLRLLGLLWGILEGGSPLLLEEPEMSLHPEVVRRLPALLAATQRHNKRQVLLSTHSPDMFRDEGIGVDEVVVMTPSAEGTVVRLVEELGEVSSLLDNGASMAEVILPQTRPPRAEQLLFPFMDDD